MNYDRYKEHNGKYYLKKRKQKQQKKKRKHKTKAIESNLGTVLFRLYMDMHDYYLVIIMSGDY